MTRRSYRVVAVVGGGHIAACVIERPGEPVRVVPIKGARVCATKGECNAWLAAWSTLLGIDMNESATPQLPPKSARKRGWI